MNSVKRWKVFISWWNAIKFGDSLTSSEILAMVSNKIREIQDGDNK